MRYDSITSTVTLRLTCVCVGDDGKRCLESATFAGTVRAAAELEALKAGWRVNKLETAAKCPACTAMDRAFGSPVMDWPEVPQPVR